MNNELRWKQRFQNFEKAYLLLNDDIEASIKSMNEREKAGVIQHFEILNELSWKILKDYLEAAGSKKIHGIKNIIRESFQNELIDNPEVWMDALDHRNKTSHIYDQSLMEDTLKFIENKFYPLVRNLYFDLKKEV